MLGWPMFPVSTAYFYVEGTFYNKTQPGGGEAAGSVPVTDLSASVAEFCKQQGMSAPPPDPSKPLPAHEAPVPLAVSHGSLAERAQTAEANLQERRYPLRRAPVEVCRNLRVELLLPLRRLSRHIWRHPLPKP